MKRKIAFVTKIGIAVFVPIVIFIAIRTLSVDPYQKRLEYTWLSLQLVKENIQTFHEITGRYPESLAELNDYIIKDTSEKFSKRENLEYISTKEGNKQKHAELNGEGGWYYNSKTGEVKVNLTKPLKVYFDNYYVFRRRNKIPAEW